MDVWYPARMFPPGNILHHFGRHSSILFLTTSVELENIDPGRYCWPGGALDDCEFAESAALDRGWDRVGGRAGLWICA
jgi:hypothetical protein